MAETSRPFPTVFRDFAVPVTIIIGVVGSALAFYEARLDEKEAAEAEFGRRASIRHTLIREIIGRYEDGLAGLRTMFVLEGNVTHEDFIRAARRIEERTTHVQAFEWVPAVKAADRAAVEATMSRSYGERSFQFTELAAGGELVRAAERPEYYPICYLQPLAGNERALGYDLKVGPTVATLEKARATRQPMATGQVKLVQETGEKMSVILIWPVYHSAKGQVPGSGETESFLGFVQGVIAVRSLLEQTRTTHPETILDALFVDHSAENPAQRVLHYLPRDKPFTSGALPTEEEFLRGPTRQYPIPMGGRTWQVLYRPHEGWLEQQMTAGPTWRAAVGLLITGLLAGLVRTVGRRAKVIERIVEKRTAELSESRRQLSSLMHALPGMAFRCRYDKKKTTVLYASEGALALTGHPAEDFMAHRVQLRDFIHPEDLPLVRAATREGLAAKREFEIEYRVRSRAGVEKWVLSRSRGVYAPDGSLTVFEGLVIDITAQKRAESERILIERKLLEGQKLESLGLLAGGIAHDFNNLLTGILGNAGLARLSLPAGGPVDPQLNAIETASMRAAELCRQMLAYAGKGRFVVEPADISVLIHGMLPLLEVSIARSARVHLDLAHDLPTVMADATQLRQIVMNLVINASDALGENPGEIDLSTGLMMADRRLLESAVAGTELPPGQYVFLKVRDTGCGMSAETIAKIFDPFFSTKFAGRGLGLAAVLGIVRGHQGALLVESKPGKGSTFQLLLPPLSQAPIEPPRPPSAKPWRHSAKVLIIEDDDAVRLVAAAVLESYGLTAAAASRGETGLALFRENPSGFDLVLLDLIMPGLSGEQTLASLRAIRPDVSVLIMSGFSESAAAERLADPRSRIGFLHKPFTREMLEQKLGDLLG